MPLTAATTDKFTKVGNPGSATTLSAPGYTIADASITVGSTTNWPTDTLVVFAIDRAEVVNGVEQRIAGTYNEFSGIVSSATAIGNLTKEYGTAQNYPAGSLTRVYIPVASTHVNKMVDGLNQDHDGAGHTKNLTDANGNEWLERGSVASAVNQVKSTNAIAGGHPLISASGDDTNIDLLLRGKGTGSPRPSGKFDAWVDANETWTYASASTIIVPTDATTRYSIGDIVKITQSATVKYFVITTVAATLLTVAGLTTETVANSAITANYYRKTSPLGTQAVTPYNPYKFSVYRNAAHTSANTPTKVTPDTELLDSNNNFSGGTYTVPVPGFYFFSACMGNTTASATPIFTYIYKNAASVKRGGGASSAAGGTCSEVSGLVQCAAADTIEIYFIGGNGSTMEVGASVAYFDGFLVSRI